MRALRSREGDDDDIDDADLEVIPAKKVHGLLADLAFCGQTRYDKAGAMPRRHVFGEVIET